MTLAPACSPVLVDRAGTRVRVLTALVIAAASIALAMSGSWIPSLWADEVISIMSAQRSFPSLGAMLSQVDAVHGAYYVGLHMWGSLFGFSPLSVRMPSAIAVGMVAAAVYLIVDRLRSYRAGVIAGLICAVLPRVTYMGEEARSYAFSAAIAAWLTFALLLALRRDRPTRVAWIVYGALLAIGIYTFLYVALFVLVHAIVLLATRTPREVVRAWAISTGAGVLTAAPVIVYALLERGQISYLGSIEQLAPDTLFSGLWFGSWPFAVAAWTLILVALGFEVRRVRVRVIAGQPALRGGDGMPSLVLIAALWMLLPAVVLIAVHPFIADFTARYVSFCAPAAAILVACGVDDLFGVRRSLGVVSGALAIILVVPVYASQRTPYAKNDADLAQISAVIGAHARSGDLVVFDESTRPSRRPRLAEYGYPQGFRRVTDVTLQVSYRDMPALRDLAYTVQGAARLGRFAGTDRTWLIEYASWPAQPDTYGVSDLEALGYHPTATRIATHRALITLYERTP